MDWKKKEDDDYFWKSEYKVFSRAWAGGGARRARSISADDDLESMFHYFAVGGREDPSAAEASLGRSAPTLMLSSNLSNQRS